jgi:hypothetical protein
MTINTRRVRGRRRLRFANLEEVVADVRQLHAGPHRLLGNWTLAQIAKHLGQVMHGSIDGSPIPFQFPLPARIVGRLVLRPYFLHVAIPKGIRLPRAATEQFMFADCEFAEAMDRLETGVARLAKETNRAVHPLLGPLSPAQWNLFHLRHCESHLSFVVPE